MSALPPALAKALAQWAKGRQLPEEVRLGKALTGGCINQVVVVHIGSQRFCLKQNAPQYTAMLQAEYEQLEALHAAGGLRYPRPLLAGCAGNAFLLMEYIAGRQKAPTFWQQFGRGLARQHRVSAPKFGFGSDNYIGNLPQPNPREPDWAIFYAAHRLQPMARRARDKGLLDASDLHQLERLCHRLPEIFPNEPPALLHGDLWGGNYLVGEQGEPVAIDPAAYYGHRELDLAMTRLFGGYPPAFYEAYAAEFPLAPGWEQRLPVGQLYYLLVHIVLFGRSYYPQTAEILRRFGN